MYYALLSSLLPSLNIVVPVFPISHCVLIENRDAHTTIVAMIGLMLFVCVAVFNLLIILLTVILDLLDVDASFRRRCRDDVTLRRHQFVLEG